MLLALAFKYKRIVEPKKFINICDLRIGLILNMAGFANELIMLESQFMSVFAYFAVVHLYSVNSLLHFMQALLDL